LLDQTGSPAALSRSTAMRQEVRPVDVHPALSSSLFFRLTAPEYQRNQHEKNG